MGEINAKKNGVLFCFFGLIINFKTRQISLFYGYIESFYLFAFFFPWKIYNNSPKILVNETRFGYQDILLTGLSMYCSKYR